MNVGRGIAIAGAFIAAAMLARGLWAQATTTPFATAYVVATCGTAPSVPSVGVWSYSAGGQAPVTMNTNGELCTVK